MTKGKHIPERTCVGCGAKRPKVELLRVVRGPEGKVFLDLSGKRSGRGAYICPNVDCFRKAVKRKALQRSLKVNRIEEDVLREIENQILKKSA